MRHGLSLERRCLELLCFNSNTEASTHIRPAHTYSQRAEVTLKHKHTVYCTDHSALSARDGGHTTSTISRATKLAVTRVARFAHVSQCGTRCTTRAKPTVPRAASHDPACMIRLPRLPCAARARLLFAILLEHNLPAPSNATPDTAWHGSHGRRHGRRFDAEACTGRPLGVCHGVCEGARRHFFRSDEAWRLVTASDQTKLGV